MLWAVDMQNAPAWTRLRLSFWCSRSLVLLLMIAFSSGTEVAMLSVNRYRIRAARQGRQAHARRLLERCCSKPDSWLGANLVILALASVAASSIATLLAQRTGYAHAMPVTMARADRSS